MQEWLKDNSLKRRTFLKIGRGVFESFRNPLGAIPALTIASIEFFKIFNSEAVLPEHVGVIEGVAALVLGAILILTTTREVAKPI